MLIGPVDLNREVLVVAEIGNNHEGSFARAQEMIGRAAETGVQAVKFQTFVPEHYISRDQAERLARLRKFAFSFEQFARLADVARAYGVIFFSTPFDLASAEALSKFCPAIKISSGDNVFFPLIEKVATFRLPVIMSTGLAGVSDLEAASDTLKRAWRTIGHTGELALLHCVSTYPTPPVEANLAAIQMLRTRFDDTIGYSDHTLGIDAAVLSVALGARIIEKHFTLDKNLSDFRDHQLSADPTEMKELVRRVRLAQEMLGREFDGPSSQAENRVLMRRSIAAAVDLPAGTSLQMRHLCWVRPGTHIPPGQEARVLGRVTRRTLRQGELISPDDIG
ncbi:MAG TPA: N-acetylneuraminate synthase family protein [Candidatus Acidoferrales bacterium]|nr:N-acetylneuraminate synthase family protein [Candidatus Acidoferrales bacterium]